MEAAAGSLLTVVVAQMDWVVEMFQIQVVVAMLGLRVVLVLL